MSAQDVGSLAPVTLRRRFVPRTWSGRVGLGLALTVCGVALIGPLFAPHSPTELVGSPFNPPSSAYPLGIDFNGRDVLSRVLWGGRTVLALGLASTILAYLVGGSIGLVAGFSRSKLDDVLMRAMDVLLAFPPLLFLLVLATGAGPSVLALVLGIATIHVPAVGRIIRAATLEVSVRGYVEAALARGEPMARILRREVVPNIGGTIAADVGPRFTVSILLVAAVNYLGLGLRPPSADWAMMISENRAALTIPPWGVSLSVFVPALLIALLTVGVNLLADSVARSLGRSVQEESLRR